MNNKLPPDNKNFLLRYASLGGQLLVAIAISIFLGIKADKWLITSPLFTSLLPLLTLIVTFIKLYRETNRTTKK
jgi:F0F1-type ATP synthase assembly protein I